MEVRMGSVLAGSNLIMYDWLGGLAGYYVGENGGDRRDVLLSVDIYIAVLGAWLHALW